jgi:hypothetical protein
MRLTTFLITLMLLLAMPLTLCGQNTFQTQVRPLLEKYCADCHKQRGKANLKLFTLNPDIVGGPDAETWHDVLNRLNRGEMPPKDAPQLAEDDRETLVSWLTGQLTLASQRKRSTRGRTVIRRLTGYEYNNTMQDLLGIDYDFALNLPPESQSPDGFKNNGQNLSISPLQIEYYLQAARTAMQKAIVVGPRPEVIHHHVVKSTSGNNKKTAVANELDHKTRFLARLLEFPRSGPFTISITAFARLPKGHHAPRMEVRLGLRADVLSPSKLLGEVDITGTEQDPQTIEMHGRIESFPLPGKNPKFPGIVFSCSNLSAKPIPKNADQATAAQPLIVITSLDFNGPNYDQWPPSHHTQILPPRDSEMANSQQRQYAADVIATFMARAYRRPVSGDEVKQVLMLYDTLRGRHPSLEETMQEVLAGVLISPSFLYLAEPRTNSRKRQPLSSHELASRLSYFLWNTMPDQQLMELANSGRLSRPPMLKQQVDRMLASPRSWNFVDHFTSQWLDLDGLDRIAVNPEYYPDFDDRLKQQMRLETQHFFAELLDKNLSALNLLDSDFTMLSPRLAEHYGLAVPTSSQFQRVAIPAGDHRGGLLGQASFLLINSNGEDSHAIKRAVWIRDRLLNDPPAPPPPDVPDLETQQGETLKLSLTEQLALHREKAACQSCHRDIDPWGIPLEHYDAVGRWREEVMRKVKGKPIRAAVIADSRLPDGTQLNGLLELKQYLLEQRSDQFSEAIARKMMTYALGRSLELTDNKEVTEITEKFISGGHQLRKLIVTIVQSDAFTTK